MILVPAYGRDYKTAAEVRKDWEAGKNFLIRDVGMGRDNGRYCSKTDFDRATCDKVGSYIRYNRLTELTHIGEWEESDSEKEGQRES